MAGELYNAISAVVSDFLAPMINGRHFNMLEAVVTSWNGKTGTAIVSGGGEVSFTSSGMLPIALGKAIVLAPIQKGRSVSAKDENLFYFAVGVV